MLDHLSRRSVLIGGTALSLSVIGRAWGQQPPPPVTVAQGQIQGTVENGIARWCAIPYAAPPVGPNRWQPPRPPAAWEGVRDASAFGPACLQPVARNEPERSLKDKPQSEDCLTLNIWAPEGATNLPVMVWIHGGSFRFGTGALELYHGTELARHGVVVVTINYRLGIFGTFAHPALGQEVNFGLLDQIAALEWVRDNIAAFGGNPSNLTLFGESAGGVSVSYLMSAKPAEGLFHRAIVQSGGLAVPLNDRGKGEEIGERLAAVMGAPKADAATLRALPAEALRDAPYSPADVMPQRDNRVIHSPLAEAFSRGASGDIPLLIGWNTAEAGFVGPRYWQNIQHEVGSELWRRLKKLCVGWGRESDDASAEQIASEWFAGANSRAMALTHKGPVHAYRFGWVPKSDRANSRGAIHTAEIPYVLGHVAADMGADADSRAVSDDLLRRWAAFAKTGDPQVSGAVAWPSLTAEANNFLRIDTSSITVGPDPAAALDEAINSADLPPRP
jgi:para-nitrobenzyl esterase